MLRLTSRDNAVIKEVVKLKGRASYRSKSKRFVIEGLRLVTDAVQSGAEIEALFCSESAEEKYGRAIAEIEKKAKKSYLLGNSLFEQISDTVTPQGIMCLCGFCKNVKAYRDTKIKTPLTAIVLENIQDPSNMGNILRTAEALGVNTVFISNDSTDIYSPKVLRGSMGAVFRLDITIIDDVIGFIGDLKKNRITVAGTVPYSTAVPITSVHDFKNTAVIIGNEGNGIKENTLKDCDCMLTIPMLGRAESLNASSAAAIVLWEMQRNAVL